MRIEEPSFSIIIPTYRRPDALRVCVQALCELDYPRSGLEVIIVDDGGMVPLQPLLEPFAERLRMKILWQPNAGPAAARNFGALQATGDLLAFTDDDCTPASSWLRGFRNGVHGNTDSAPRRTDGQCVAEQSVFRDKPVDHRCGLCPLQSSLVGRPVLRLQQHGYSSGAISRSEWV